MDEDETIEVVAFGGEVRGLIHIGLDMAMMRARSAYVRGDIEVDEFEAEVERILRKHDQTKGLRR